MNTANGETLMLTAPQRDGPAGAAEARGFWIVLLLFDALVLLFLSRIGWVAAGIFCAAAVVLFVARVEWLLAFVFLGTPLLWPLALRPDAQAAAILGTRLLLLPAWWWSFTRAAAGPVCGPRHPAVGRMRAIIRWIREPAVLWMMALALLLSLRLPASLAPKYGSAKLTAFFLENVVFFLAPALMWPYWRNPRHLDRLLRALVIVGGIFVAGGLAHVVGLAGGIGWSDASRDPATGVPGRLGWLGTDPIWTGRMLGIWLVLLGWANARRLLKRPALLLLAIPAFWLLLRTGSRGPLAALLLSPLAILVLPRGVAPRGRRASVVALRALCLIGLVAAAVALLPDSERARLTATLLRTPLGTILGAGGPHPGATFEDGVLSDPSVAYRLEVVRRGAALLGEVLPWGAGTGSFPGLLFLRDLRLYPHNIEAELLIEQGLPGLLLFLFFLLAIVRSGRRLVAVDATHVWILILLAMAFLNAQVSGDLSGNGALWFWSGLLCGLHLAAFPRRGCEQNP
ncbi:MAG: O-antigen ligase family protein [Candidatus Eisenbacteria bacterium]